MDKKSNHRVNVVRIPAVLPHGNADSLEIIHIEGYQVVVKKGEFIAGDLGVYIQPDSIVPITEPFKFIWEDHMVDDGNGGFTVPEKRRRITVRKFRGEWSEGLLLPLKDVLPEEKWIKEGYDVSDFIGITHYDPDADKEGVGENGAAPKRQRPQSLKGWFYFLLHKIGIKPQGVVNGWDRETGVNVPVYDVEAYKNYAQVFQDKELVIVTEKIHGSNARYVYLEGKMYVGSRNLWKSEKSNCIWRRALKDNPWIETWCKAFPGDTLYGEVVPTQGKYTYGCKNGEVKFFVFDILRADGTWVSPDPNTQSFTTVPILYFGPFNLDVILPLVDGPSTVEGAKHIREGVVITPFVERREIGLGRVKLKIVSNDFLKEDSK